MTRHINIVNIVILFLHLDFATNDDITRPDSIISSFFFFLFWPMGRKTMKDAEHYTPNLSY